MDRIFAKTKILATLGPATDTPDKLKSLLNAGVDGFRLNFSHGNHSYFSDLLSGIKTACKEENLTISILQDLQGPKIRVGELSQPEISLNSGERIEIVTEDIPGTKDRISTTYKNLAADSSIGDKILVDDGLIRLLIISKNQNSVTAEIIQGGILKARKGMNLPGMKLSTPALTEKDYRDLEFGLNFPVNYVALSFVRKADDIRILKNWLTEKKVSRSVIAKIEKPEALDNFEEILSVSDGIMIARGDLGVEMKPQDIPVIQKRIITRCNQAGKLVITATQMLESMVNSSIPTRAEASDVANAVLDGTDVVMLSAETSIGKYPVEAVKVMNDILFTTESAFESSQKISYDIPAIQADNFFDAAGRAVSLLANQLDAKAIIVFTEYGRKAQTISKYRPNAKIVAVSNNIETVNKLNMYWGIASFYKENINEDEKVIENTKKLLIRNLIAVEGDFIIFTSGAPIGEKGRRNWIQFMTI